MKRRNLRSVAGRFSMQRGREEPRGIASPTRRHGEREHLGLEGMCRLRELGDTKRRR